MNTDKHGFSQNLSVSICVYLVVSLDRKSAIQNQKFYVMGDRTYEGSGQLG